MAARSGVCRLLSRKHVFSQSSKFVILFPGSKGFSQYGGSGSAGLALHHCQCAGLWRYTVAINNSSSRHFSTDRKPDEVVENIPVGYIPPPPDVPQTPDITLTDTPLLDGAEPSFASLDLGGWTPVGIVQQCLEFFHIGVGMPWWAAIATGTLILRFALFPLVIKAQRNAAHMNNHLPQMQLLQMKMTEARSSGNAMDAARYSHELMVFMKEKNINPIKGLIIPLVQGPIFISVFLGLKGLTNLPIESMKYGGIFWFTNLTISDPFYLLPIMTSATLFLTLELGLESGVRADNMQLMRYGLRLLPLIIFPFTLGFPAGILCYWFTNNVVSLGQLAVLRIDPVRQYFNLPKLIKHKAENLPAKKKGVVESFKDAYTNSKIAKEMEDRARVDEVRFRKAGMGPIQKTYAIDPTKQRSKI